MCRPSAILHTAMPPLFNAWIWESWPGLCKGQPRQDQQQGPTGVSKVPRDSMEHRLWNLRRVLSCFSIFHDTHHTSNPSMCIMFGKLLVLFLFTFLNKIWNPSQKTQKEIHIVSRWFARVHRCYYFYSGPAEHIHHNGLNNNVCSRSSMILGYTYHMIFSCASSNLSFYVATAQDISAQIWASDYSTIQPLLH